MAREHTLKTWPSYWDALSTGEKMFEVRRDDRGFQKGDILVLQKWDPEKGRYICDDWTGARRELRRKITYVLTGGRFGVEPGYVVLGLKRA